VLSVVLLHAPSVPNFFHLQSIGQVDSGKFFVADHTSELAVLDRALFESALCILSPEAQGLARSFGSKASVPLYSHNGRLSPTTHVSVLRNQPHRPGHAPHAGTENVGMLFFNDGQNRTASRFASSGPDAVVAAVSAPTLARQLSEDSQGVLSSSPNGHQRSWGRITFKSLGSISGPDEAARIASSQPQISGRASFSQSPSHSPIAINQHTSQDAVPKATSFRQVEGGISWTDSDESRRLLPANHPMAKGWLGSSAPDEENLEDVRRGVRQGQEELKASIQKMVQRSQVFLYMTCVATGPACHRNADAP